MWTKQTEKCEENKYKSICSSCFRTGTCSYCSSGYILEPFVVGVQCIISLTPNSCQFRMYPSHKFLVRPFLCFFLTFPVNWVEGVGHFGLLITWPKYFILYFFFFLLHSVIRRPFPSTSRLGPSGQTMNSQTLLTYKQFSNVNGDNKWRFFVVTNSTIRAC